MSVHMEMPVAFLENSGSAVYFSSSPAAAGVFPGGKGTVMPVREMQTALKVAPWGEDNRFPQNIEAQMAYCGIGKSALDWKARALWGAGIVAGRITGYEDEGRKEIFEPISPEKDAVIYKTLNSRWLFRFFLEYLQDWTWFSNCFPEAVLSNDGKTITHFVHQESCDARFMQMNDNGDIDTVYLSKLWGAAKQQFARFDPEKSFRGLMENPQQLTKVDNKFVKALDCIDMYDAVASLEEIATKMDGRDGLKSAILPVNYPSVNKTYYQVASWDGARLAGWIEIASKIPALLKVLYTKAAKLKYHIEVPLSFFERKYGFEDWHGWTAKQRTEKMKTTLKEMDDYLSSTDKAYGSFLSVFDVDPREHKEYGRVKITAIEDKVNLDKELITSSAADLQVLIAMQAHPTLFGAGTLGSGQQRTGGSDQREAFLIYNAQLNLERNVLLEPLYLMRDYNREVGGVPEWSEDIVFRVRDTVLTTLDKGKGTEKTLS